MLDTLIRGSTWDKDRDPTSFQFVSYACGSADGFVGWRSHGQLALRILAELEQSINEIMIQHSCMISDSRQWSRGGYCSAGHTIRMFGQHDTSSGQIIRRSEKLANLDDEIVRLDSIHDQIHTSVEGV